MFSVPEKAARLDLYLAHRPALINYAKGVLGDRAGAEDVVQDAFLRFSEPTGQPLEQPVAYLYRIVRNLALDAIRRRGSENRQQQSPPQWMQPGQQLSPEQQLLDHHDVSRVAATLADLPEQMRIAVEMHRLGGYTLQQIATHLSISPSMAHRLVRDAVVHLASSIDADDPVQPAQRKERPRA
jgi:RNA polymerase sigma-70 factor (ECF subfamily)